MFSKNNVLACSVNLVLTIYVFLTYILFFFNMLSVNLLP